MAKRGDTFQLFRVSLALKSQMDVEQLPLTREQHLRDAFGQSWSFLHRKVPFDFVQIDTDPAAPDVVFGRIGRPIRREENKSREEGFAEVDHNAFKAALFVLDPTGWEDGQKIALQIDPEVGTPFSVLTSLVEHINAQTHSSPFLMEVQPLFDGHDFWRFVGAHKHEITRLAFHFTAPNGPWSLTTSLKADQEAYKKITGATQIDTTFKNPEGLDVDNDFIREAVEYTETGSGTVKAKTKSGASFSSTSTPITVRLPDEALDEPLLAKAIRRLNVLLGRSRDA